MKFKHPLAEVFGFPVDNLKAVADRHRSKRLCPFNNKVASCTKDKANAPLGVCSIFEKDKGNLAITCPIRFRENWIVADDAADFFFAKNTKWTTINEVRLNDAKGGSAGNIDVAIVSYDENGKLLDFGALEVQAVYISGNIRRPFEAYMNNPSGNSRLDWEDESNYPRPDYLSSSRKRLLPQLVYKGSILNAWGKKVAVAIHEGFFNTLPALKKVTKEKAEIAWLIYGLVHDPNQNRYNLSRIDTVYTLFDPALRQITQPNVGKVESFVQVLQDKLDEQLDGIAPETKTLGDLTGD